VAASHQLLDSVGLWLPRARWFAAKAADIERIDLADAVDLDGGVTVLLLDVAAGSTTDRYVVPVHTADGSDAAASPACAGWLVHTALGGRTSTGRSGRFVGHAVRPGGLPPPADVAPEAVLPLGIDATNTSLQVRLPEGRWLAVKLLRRCRPGVQPEVEVGAFLARDAAAAPWDGTPALRGWVGHAPSSDDGPTSALATVHDFLPDCRGAWELLLARETSGGPHAGPAADGRGLGAVDEVVDGVDRVDDVDRVDSVVEEIGRLTGRLHAALASRGDLPDFAPEQATASQRRHAAMAMAGHARRVLARAADPPSTLPPDIVARLRAVAAAGPGLVARLEALGGRAESAAWIRLHGDYHLGQVLVADGPFGLASGRPRAWVIDFEGEPGRSLAERRAKASAAKDVAGMCRSFDYLVRCAASAGGPAYRPQRVRQLEEGFLAGYRQVATGAAWWPPPPEAARLMEAYALDKALYELAYELDHRPGWVGVPLAAIEAVSAGG